MRDSSLHLVSHRQTGVVEHGQHGPVVSQRVGDEPVDSDVACSPRQVLEQTCAQPAALPAVGDHERHLGIGAGVEAVEAGDTDDLSVGDGDDGLGSRWST